jgi:hypothetical protein
MKHQKPLIRRTFLQERFIILMELKEKGIANFDELTELDELINRDPKLRDIILEEMEEANPPLNMPDNNIFHVAEVEQRNLIDRLSSFISGLFHFKKYIYTTLLSR